ncbi:MAG: hypothetical protein ACP5O1_09085 [Phycisphaerae bacterium]
MIPSATTFWSSMPIWLPIVAAGASAILVLALRRSLRIAEQVCLVVSLIAALAVVSVKNVPGVIPAFALPATLFGRPTHFQLTGVSLTLLIFVLISFMFSLSWLRSARPGSKSLFWLSLQFALIWGLATASDLFTLFICAQLLMVPQYFLNLNSGAAHHRRIARRMFVVSIINSTLILAAAILAGSPGNPHVGYSSFAALPSALLCILLSIWISLSLFPFHGVQTTRITVDGRNLLPLNSNIWVGLALMMWLQHSLLLPQLHTMIRPLAIAGTVAMAACSVACFAQRELSRSMAYAAAAVSAFAFLAWISQNIMGVAGAMLILGVLPVTVFGFQRGIDLLFLQAQDISALPEGRSSPGGAAHLLFLLLTAACIGMPATAVFRGVWFALIGMIKAAAQSGRIEFQTVIFGVLALSVLVPMILGVISRSLLAFRDPAQNIRRPDINVHAGGIGAAADSTFTAPLNLDAYIRAARRWAILAMMVSLVLGVFPILAIGPLLESLQHSATTSTPSHPILPPALPFHEVIVDRISIRAASMGASLHCGGNIEHRLRQKSGAIRGKVPV